MCEILNQTTPTLIDPRKDHNHDSDEDLTEDQIIEGLTKLTAECLADEQDY
jgi:hypothetical protein